MDLENVCAERQITQEEKMTLNVRKIQKENPKDSMPLRCRILKPNKR